MGHGIAQVSAQSGYEVVLVDVVPAALERGKAQIAKGYERLVGKGKLAAEDRDQALAVLQQPEQRERQGRGGRRRRRRVH